VVDEVVDEVGFDHEEVAVRCPDRIRADDYYEQLFELGLEFGESFRGLREIWHGAGEALGRVRLPEHAADDAHGYALHPALLDACFHLLGAPLPASGDDHAYLLIAIDELRLYRPGATDLWNHTVLRPGYDAGGETFVGDIRLYDPAGRLVAEVLGVHLKLATREALLRATRWAGGPSRATEFGRASSRRDSAWRPPITAWWSGWSRWSPTTACSNATQTAGSSPAASAPLRSPT
jgi:acyl transferase domain-containing protein